MSGRRDVQKPYAFLPRLPEAGMGHPRVTTSSCGGVGGIQNLNFQRAEDERGCRQFPKYTCSKLVVKNNHSLDTHAPHVYCYQAAALPGFEQKYPNVGRIWFADAEELERRSWSFSGLDQFRDVLSPRQNWLTLTITWFARPRKGKCKLI